MKNENRDVALNFNAQARYFLEAAMLASKHAHKNRKKHPIAFNNFETVIVGTHHAFSAELLLKGIIYFHEGKYPQCHKIENLLEQKSCKQLKESIKVAFQPKTHISYSKEQLEDQLNKYLKNLNIKDKNDKKEIENIQRIRKDLEFGSFEYFLELHSNHFVKMRYACEKLPPPLDMNFTTFLNEQLRNELENNLLEL